MIKGFVVGLALLIVGFVIEFVAINLKISPLSAPFNIYFGFLFIVLLIWAYANYRETNFMKWLSSVPAAISSIITFVVLVIIMFSIPQEQEVRFVIINYYGLEHVKYSWSFLLVQMFLLSTLGLVTLRRAFPFTLKSSGFFFNHFGIWLIIFSAMVGLGDIKSVNVNVIENEKETNIGIHENGKLHKLPFSIKLLDFSIDDTNLLKIPIDSMRKITTLIDFQSKIVIFQDSIPNDTILLNNKNSISINKWKLHQTGFDLAKANESSLSIFQAVYNPWLQVMYVGFGIFVVGLVLMLVNYKTKS